MRAPASGVPVMLLEIDRRTEDAHDLVHKLRRYWEWGRLLAPDTDRSRAARSFWRRPHDRMPTSSATSTAPGTGPETIRRKRRRLQPGKQHW